MTRLLAEIEDETLMDLMIQLNDAIRLSLDYYEDRVKGRAAPEPPVVVPTVLRRPGEGERKEGKEAESGGGGKGQQQQQQQQQQAVDSFDALANRPQQPRLSPQPGLAAPAAAPSGASPLDQFDPLA